LVLGVRQGAYLDDVPKDVEVISLDRPRSSQRLFPLVRLLRERRPDVLLSTLQQNNLIAMWAKLLAGVDTRVILRQGTPFTERQIGPAATVLDRVSTGLYWIFYPKADAFIATSHGVADDLVNNVGVPRDKIRLIYNGVIASDFFARSEEEVSHPFFTKDGPPVFLGVGRLTPEKGFATLIDAFAEYRRSAPAKLVFLGEGPLRETLEQRCASHGMVADVAFLGFQRNPYAYMRRATALVVASLYEGFGNALAEALALGTFTISTDCPSGPADILDHGRFGLLVPVGDAAAMAAAMRTAAMQRAPFPGQQDWARQFTVEHAAERYEAVIDEVSGRGVSRAPRA
jgi:glycosyltransferase involved in cell wall biosynthesis